MHISPNNQLNNLRDQILDFILNCQKIFGLSDELMARQLQLSLYDFNLFKYQKEDINIGKFEEFLKKINVSAVSIFSNSVDYDKVFHHFYGNMDYLQSKYSVGASGRKRTIINILDYIEKTKGKLEKLRILRRFQMSPFQFQDPDEMINNNFIVDLFDQLLRDGYSLADIVKMGEYSYESHKSSVFGKTLAKQRNKKELIEFTATELNGSFDHNFHYEVRKCNNEVCVLRVRQNEEVAELMKVRTIGSFPLSISKLGVMSSLPRYIGEEDYNINLLQSSYHGNRYCEYEILLS